MNKPIRFFGVLLLALGVLAAVPAQSVDALGENRYVVKLKTGVSPSDVASPQAIQSSQDAFGTTLKQLNAEEVVFYDNFAVVSLVIDDSKLAELQAANLVEAVEKSRLHEVSVEDTQEILGIDVAHDRGYHGSGTSVVVIDSGSEIDHPYYNVIDGACFSNTSNYQNAESTCPNGQTTQTGIAAAEPCVIQTQECGHGTHVAGIVAGASSNIRGVAPRTNIIAINVFLAVKGPAVCGITYGADDYCNRAMTEDILAGLDYALTLEGKYASSQNKVAAVNMSLGSAGQATHCDSTAEVTKTQIDLLNRSGVTVVAASGNSGLNNSVGFPACLSNVLAVGATDYSDKVASFSNISPIIDVYAPGVGIASSIPDAGFERQSGTSMASPAVAGAVAVLKSASPGMTPAQITAALKESGVTITTDRAAFSAKRVNVTDALESIVGSAKAGNDIDSRIDGVNPCRINHLAGRYATTKVSLPVHNEVHGAYIVYVKARSTTNMTGKIAADMYPAGEGYGYYSTCNGRAYEPTTSPSGTSWRFIPIILHDAGKDISTVPSVNELTLYFAQGIEIDSVIIRSGGCTQGTRIDAFGVCEDEEFTRNIFIESIDSSRFITDSTASNGAYTSFGPSGISKQLITDDFGTNSVLGATDTNGIVNYGTTPIRQASISVPVLMLSMVAMVGALTVVVGVVYMTHYEHKKLPVKQLSVVGIFAVTGTVLVLVTQAGAPPVQRYEIENFNVLPAGAETKVDAGANGGATVIVR